jgi:hypothetical protein
MYLIPSIYPGVLVCTPLLFGFLAQCVTKVASGPLRTQSLIYILPHNLLSYTLFVTLDRTTKHSSTRGQPNEYSCWVTRVMPFYTSYLQYYGSSHC